MFKVTNYDLATARRNLFRSDGEARSEMLAFSSVRCQEVYAYAYDSWNFHIGGMLNALDDGCEEADAYKKELAYFCDMDADDEDNAHILFKVAEILTNGQVRFITKEMVRILVAKAYRRVAKELSEDRKAYGF